MFGKHKHPRRPSNLSPPRPPPAPSPPCPRATFLHPDKRTHIEPLIISPWDTTTAKYGIAVPNPNFYFCYSYRCTWNSPGTVKKQSTEQASTTNAVLLLHSVALGECYLYSEQDSAPTEPAALLLLLLCWITSKTARLSRGDRYATNKHINVNLWCRGREKINLS